MDIDFFITGVSALLKLIQSETGLMQGIIPMKHERKVFDMIVQAGLNSIFKEGEVSFHFEYLEVKDLNTIFRLFLFIDI